VQQEQRLALGELIETHRTETARRAGAARVGAARARLQEEVQAAMATRRRRRESE